ncbi:MAG TPA: ThiF family adenylyltransferase [Pseudomonadota bacterium]|nr:ThiF family adenylyltransferase [Pseudomonadota bacterium]
MTVANAQAGPSRYDRQTRVKEIGAAGQAKIAASVAVVAGLGALGTTVANLLARAGVGMLRLVDRDVVERSNLQRQCLYDEEDAAQSLPKAEAAVAHLKRVNSEIRYEAIVDDINGVSVEKILAGATVLVDGLDNFHARALVNEACVKHGIPWVYGAGLATYGSTATVVPGVTACLRCVMPTAALEATLPLTCETVGVLGPVTSLVGAWQASEALKIMVGNTEHACRDLVHFELWDNEVTTLPARRAEDCEVCVKRQFALLERRERVMMTSLCGRDAVQVVPPASFKLDFGLLRDTLSGSLKLQENGHLLKFRADDHDMVVFPDGRAIIFGTADSKQALSLYGKYIGG